MEILQEKIQDACQWQKKDTAVDTCLHFPFPSITKQFFAAILCLDPPVQRATKYTDIAAVKPMNEMV